MPKFPRADYSGALPVLLPANLVQHWRGFYLPTTEGEEADLVLEDGGYAIHADFEAEPRTDYDRARALGVKPAVHTVPVGPGCGLVFVTELDHVIWWAERCVLVNGAELPDLSRLERVVWSDELEWQTEEEDFVLMNACDHGAAPRDDHFRVRLEPGRYVVQLGRYGWSGNDPALMLFRFLKREGP